MKTRHPLLLNRFYLVGHWLMFQPRLVQDLFNLKMVEVGDSKGFHQPLIDQLLQDLSQKRIAFRWFCRESRDPGLAWTTLK